MSTTTVTLGLVYANTEFTDRVDTDKYIVFGESVDLESELCSCGESECFHLASAMVHQARFNARSAA